ncbi:hypothetical protein JHK87_053055 [Glycine soja]|nr:hypothetical protein JHK87_053055 [Glycine soja]
MTLVWRPKCGVEITEVKYGIFLFRFFFHLVVQRILKGRPWSFDKHLLILGVIKEGANPTTIPLFLVPFWIQMHNLPLGFMSQEVGQSIDEFCDHFFAMPMDDGTRHWSSELYTMITEESAVKYLHGGRHGPSVAVTKTKTIATINAIMRMGNRQQMSLKIRN